MNNQALKDIDWWRRFLLSFSGTSILWLLDVPQIDSEFAVDACMKGAGGYREGEYYRVLFPTEFEKDQLKITHLELWAVILAVRIWGPDLKGKIIHV